MVHSRAGANRFGDGNLPQAWQSFPDEHRCNAYCEYFGLLAPEFEGKLRWEKALDGETTPDEPAPGVDSLANFPSRPVPPDEHDS